MSAERQRFHTRLTASRSEIHVFNFITALILTAQNGFGRDVEPFLSLSREAWGEEILFDAIKDLPHGALQKKGTVGELLFEKDAVGERLLDANGKPIPVMDPFGFGKQRTRLMFAARVGDVARVRWLSCARASVIGKGALRFTGLSALRRNGRVRRWRLRACASKLGALPRARSCPHIRDLPGIGAAFFVNRAGLSSLFGVRKKNYADLFHASTKKRPKHHFSAVPGARMHHS